MTNTPPTSILHLLTYNMYMKKIRSDHGSVEYTVLVVSQIISAYFPAATEGPKKRPEGVNGSRFKIIAIGSSA